MTDNPGQLLHCLTSAIRSLEELSDAELASIDDDLLEQAGRLDLLAKEANRANTNQRNIALLRKTV